VKKILAALVLVALLLTAFIVRWDYYWREIQPPDGEEVFLGQVDRYEIDDNDREWVVISFDAFPYSVSCPANEEINSETASPGTWVCFSLDGDFPYQVRVMVFV